MEHPNAKKLLDEVEVAAPLGIRLNQNPGKDKAPSLQPFFLEQKRRWPMHVLLVRVRLAYGGSWGRHRGAEGGWVMEGGELRACGCGRSVFVCAVGWLHVPALLAP